MLTQPVSIKSPTHLRDVIANDSLATLYLNTYKMMEAGDLSKGGAKKLLKDLMPEVLSGNLVMADNGTMHWLTGEK